MMMLEPTVENAARLVYKGLQSSQSPATDGQYRELLGLYRALPNFAEMVRSIAAGLELDVLDFSERGLMLAPTSKDSRFAVRMTDLRAGLKPDQKAVLLLAHVAIASVFFPTTDGVEDDNYVPPPASIGEFRDALGTLARHLKEDAQENPEIPQELAPGWDLVCALPGVVPSAQRASPNSVTGLVSIALNNMQHGGLVRLDREASEEAQMTYTATHRLRVQLRELTLRALFELAQYVVTTKSEVA
ncbi:hypothetical protein GCM10027202_36180 [Microvirgula curvata]